MSLLRSPGSELIERQEVQVKNALLEGPKTDAELVKLLGTTARRINLTAHQLRSNGEIYHDDGKWHLYDFAKGGLEHGTSNGEDKKTKL